MQRYVQAQPVSYMNGHVMIVRRQRSHVTTFGGINPLSRESNAVSSVLQYGQINEAIDPSPVPSKAYSRRTEKTYVHWIKRFIYSTGKRHSAEMGAPEVTAFLNNLATARNVAAATRNQALSALLFLYQQVLGHKDVSTTSYTHVMNKGGRSVKSPLDRAAQRVAEYCAGFWLPRSLGL